MSAARPAHSVGLGDIETIRAGVDLVAIVSPYVELRRAGTQFVGLCPFHRERRASFYVHPEKQLFYCHGCGGGGDVFTFIERIEHVDFRTAKIILSEIAGVPVYDRPPAPDQKRKYASWQDERELIEHFRSQEGYPLREAARAAADYRVVCQADPEFIRWLRQDLERAKAICILIIGMLAAAQQRDGDFPVAAEEPTA